MLGIVLPFHLCMIVGFHYQIRIIRMFIVAAGSLGLKTGTCVVCSNTGTFAVLLWNVAVVVGVLSILFSRAAKHFFVHFLIKA